MTLRDKLLTAICVVLIVAAIRWASKRGAETANPDDPSDDPGPH